MGGEAGVAALVATFAQSGSGGVSYRELVAGLAPLARAAKADGAATPFVERAVARMRAKHF